VANIQVILLCYLASSVNKGIFCWSKVLGPPIACIWLLTATSAFRLGRIRYSSPQQCYLQHFIPCISH